MPLEAPATSPNSDYTLPLNFSANGNTSKTGFEEGLSEITGDGTRLRGDRASYEGSHSGDSYETHGGDSKSQESGDSSDWAKIRSFTKSEDGDDSATNFKLHKIEDASPSYGKLESILSSMAPGPQDSQWFSGLGEREQALLRRIALFEAKNEALQSLKQQLYQDLCKSEESKP